MQCYFSIGTVCNRQAQLRPVSMLFPDCLPVVEVWLVCCGFTEAKPLAMKINTFFKLINEQVTINVLHQCMFLGNCPPTPPKPNILPKVRSKG